MVDSPTLDELDTLRAEWEQEFAEPMPWGFEIGLAQLPMMRQCLLQHSRATLEEYVRSLGDRTY